MHPWWKYLKISKKKTNLLNSLLFVYMNRHVGWIALTEEIKEYLIRIHVKCFDCGYNMDTLGLKFIHKGYLDRREINIVKLLMICQVNNIFEASSDIINLQKWREDVRSYITVVL